MRSAESLSWCFPCFTSEDQSAWTSIGLKNLLACVAIFRSGWVLSQGKGNTITFNVCWWKTFSGNDKFINDISANRTSPMSPPISLWSRSNGQTQLPFCHAFKRINDKTSVLRQLIRKTPLTIAATQITQPNKMKRRIGPAFVMDVIEKDTQIRTHRLTKNVKTNQD